MQTSKNISAVARNYAKTGLLSLFLLGSCFIHNDVLGQRKKIRSKDTSIIKTKPPKNPKDIVIKYGLASFYAKKFNGRKTATGDIFSSGKFTAACNVLPLGTWVKVTNVRNNRSVIVLINDRLHAKNKRLIDLTRTAAQKLGFVSRGITKVKVEVLGRLRKK